VRAYVWKQKRFRGFAHVHLIGEDIAEVEACTQCRKALKMYIVLS
jgi:hypothetical protein